MFLRFLFHFFFFLSPAHCSWRDTDRRPTHAASQRICVNKAQLKTQVTTEYTETLKQIYLNFTLFLR